MTVLEGDIKSYFFDLKNWSFNVEFKGVIEFEDFYLDDFLVGDDFRPGDDFLTAEDNYFNDLSCIVASYFFPCFISLSSFFKLFISANNEPFGLVMLIRLLFILLIFFYFNFKNLL